jgi:uncharacterized protein
MSSPAQVELFNHKKANEFLSWIDGDGHLDSPNQKQRQFIQRYEERFAVLQGPPGTGKTVTLSYSLLARAFARLDSNEDFRGLVVAPSNRATNALLEKTDALLHQWRARGPDTEDDPLDDLQLVRAVSRDVDVREDQYDESRFVNYHTDEEAISEIKRDLTSGQTGLDAFGSGGSANSGILVCSTPSGGYKLVEKIYDDGTEPHFELLAADEASMMSVPDLLVPGASTTEGAQILVSGDHRQMPPVQQHDWDREDRRIVEEIAPFLSTMDFFRLFSEDDDFTGGENLELVDVPTGQFVPIDRLAITYRCHAVVAEFLRRLIYRDDGIEYRSNLYHQLNVQGSHRPGVRRAMHPDYPLVLIVHDEQESQQSNPFEAGIISKLVDAAADSESTGVVTPHNAQRGRLRTTLRGRVDDDSVDTVERFQGGERNLIIVSATVSDPDYIRREAEFILSPERLNVAMSRMKKKLVLVVPRSLINVIPSDKEQYKSARKWKRMYDIITEEADDEPWSGKVSEMIGEVPERSSDASLNIYTVANLATDAGRQSG